VSGLIPPALGVKIGAMGVNYDLGPTDMEHHGKKKPLDATKSARSIAVIRRAEWGGRTRGI
jgi:hypothetical protein